LESASVWPLAEMFVIKKDISLMIYSCKPSWLKIRTFYVPLLHIRL
jgi:hypothetical protein